MRECEASKFASGVKIVLKQGNLKFIQKTKKSKIWRKNAKKVKKSAFYAFFNQKLQISLIFLISFGFSFNLNFLFKIYNFDIFLKLI